MTKIACAIRSIGMISFFIPWSSGKQARHFSDGRVEDVEDELRRDTDCEHEQSDRNDDELFASQKIGKRAATFDERTAEERLHRAHKRDRRDKQTYHCDSGERSRDGE